MPDPEEVDAARSCCLQSTQQPVCVDVTLTPAPAPEIRTSDFYKTCSLPKRFDHPAWFYGYGIQRKPPLHPCYRTTSSDYGRFPPSVHTVPSCFYPNSQAFSNRLLKAGMYRNYSLNTAIDRDV